MAEYIEREAAYPLAKKICDAIDSDEFQRLNFGMRILDWIDDIPAADVRPVMRGSVRIKRDISSAPNADTACRMFSRVIMRARMLCLYLKKGASGTTAPNCGADMRGGEQDGRL